MRCDALPSHRIHNGLHHPLLCHIDLLALKVSLVLTKRRPCLFSPVSHVGLSEVRIDRRRSANDVASEESWCSICKHRKGKVNTLGTRLPREIRTRYRLGGDLERERLPSLVGARAKECLSRLVHRGQHLCRVGNLAVYDTMPRHSEAAGR